MTEVIVPLTASFIACAGLKAATADVVAVRSPLSAYPAPSEDSPPIVTIYASGAPVASDTPLPRLSAAPYWAE